MSRDHWITVKATKRGSSVEFEPICDELYKGGNRFVFNKDDLNMSKNDSHKLKFVIDDRTDLELRFPTFPEDAMWVKQIPNINSYSAPGKNDHDYSVMRPLNVIDGGKRLIAQNTNRDERKWAFALNFVDKNGKTWCWDPVGDNQDGGRPLVRSNLAAYIGIALGAGVVSAVVATTLTLMAFRLV